MSEILAPCGGMESLSAALNAGADAVYVGMKSFSARKNAENFTDGELAAACTECHRRGVKLYVALNTLMYDDEAEAVAQCIKTAAKCGADGLIIQDIGTARLAREIAPTMERHASTQLTLNSVNGVKAAEEMGFSRVVIGRELSLEQIKRIKENTDAEIEIFVHGALCVCVSGQCYMSSLFGGRSGNRGLCAQPCRLDFSCGGRHNVISLKDSSLAEHLPALAELGITSFKIEGRMKRPEYVACAVDACRKSLDGEEYDRERLEGIFSRGGLTDGYFTGEMRGMQGIRGRDDVEASAKALSGIKAIYKDEYPRIRTDITVTAQQGEPISASASACGITVTARGAVPQQAQSAPATEESVCARMSKLGGTQFFAGEITARVGEGLYIPASELNALRRDICERLDNAVLAANTPHYALRDVGASAAPAKKLFPKTRFRAEVSTAEQLRQALSLPFEIVYAPMGIVDENTPDKDRVCVIPPLYLADCEEETARRLDVLRKFGFSSGLAHTLGHARLLRECGFAVRGGYRMNILNSLSAGVCGELGFADITLSFEGTAAKLSEIRCGIPKGIVAYGRLPLMTMRRCPIADGKPCGRVSPFGEGTPCGGSLTDRRGNNMPILCGGNSVELLNPDTLIMSDRQSALSAFDFAVLKFTTETELAPVLDMYLNNKKPSGSLTRGLYFRGAE
ncbi:MAG: U32 family peptidase [Oscillospiraceae bacterium]